MDVNSRNRTELKSYFLKNSIPTESNFAELIDGMINQKDDGVVRLPGNPLSIEAVGDDNSPKKVINFYRNFTAAQPDWTISLNPWANANDSTTARAGFAITDGEGNNRLFIDRSTGHIGIKTTTPKAALDIKADTTTAAGWFEAIQLSQDAHSAITHPGGGLLLGLHGNRKFYFGDIKGGTFQKYVTVIDAESGNVGIGTDNPSGKLTVAGVSEGERGIEVLGSIGNSHIPYTNGSVYLTGYNGNDKKGDFLFRTYNGSKYTERLFIDGTTGHLGIKTTTPGAALDVKADTKTDRGWFEAIRLSQDAHSAITHPGGGLLFGLHGNRKFYFGDFKDGSFQKYVTVIDAESGRVGIGTDSPSGKLTVDGIKEDEVGLEVLGSVGNSHIPYTNGSIYLTGYNGNNKNGHFVFRTYDGSKYANKLVIDGATGIIEQQSWQTISKNDFKSGWVNYGGDYHSAGYFKDSMGIVHLRGLVKNGVFGWNETIFVLPAGYRPQGRELQIVCTNINTVGRVDVLTDGRIIPVSGDAGWFSLDGVAFRAA